MTFKRLIDLVLLAGWGTLLLSALLILVVGT